MTIVPFRSHHTKLRDEWNIEPGQDWPRFGTYQGQLPHTSDDLAHATSKALDQLVASCAIDNTLPASPDFPATAEAAQERLEQAISMVLPGYAARRNNPAIEHSTSMLSPYLRFGLVSINALYRKVKESDAEANDKWKFLDEALTWREWAHYKCAHNSRLLKYEALPEQAKQTLDAHRNDPRQVYDIADLVHGRTDDILWNAAQKQWLATGWMHHNLRMYWSTQILRWTGSPEDAWSAACYMNDKLSLDGRDPATYASMRSAFGEGRPAYKAKPIYGTIFQSAGKMLRRRPGAEEFVDFWNSNTSCPMVDCSDWTIRKMDYQ